MIKKMLTFDLVTYHRTDQTIAMMIVSNDASQGNLEKTTPSQRSGKFWDQG